MGVLCQRGSFRKHYGNLDIVIDWGESARSYYKNNPTSNLLDEKFWYKEGITYTDISSTRGPTFRYLPPNCVFDKAGPALNNVKYSHYILAFFNSKVAQMYLDLLNPTMHIQVRDVKNLPIILEEDVLEKISEIQLNNVKIAKEDWDSFETSFDYQKHPFMNFNQGSIKETYELWNKHTHEKFNFMKANEEKLNEYFIRIYGLKEVLPNVDDRDITARKGDLERDIKSYISYAIGCILGRYSIEEDGLIFTGGEFNPEKYQSFQFDRDNILPILPGAYFEDDIVSKFIEFVRVTFAEEKLAENLEFIADTLGKKKGETAKETIRRYFLNDFFKDHVQTYKKRPIYWLFTSGKQKAFNCLIYMHRYDKTTLSRIRTDYLHEYQIRLDAEKKDLLGIIEGDYTTKEISNAKKGLKALDKKIEELKEYDELLHHMADMQMEIDLDDGVVVNYEKFKGLVAKI
ncbi:BREX-1 system adenine-specific DNA-methyltransferase PglX [Bacillus pacificus]